MPPRNVVLIGFMGSGKTATARALASRIGYDAVDTDATVEREAGATIAEIFEREGEPAFRELEARVVEKAVTRDGTVIACGGGTILADRNLALLRDAGPIVYLRASAATLVARVADGAARPLLAGDPQRVVPQLLEEREPHYLEAADLVIDTDDRTPEDVAALIAERLR